MIILDTNVISEPMGSTPDPRVLAWIDTQNFETFRLNRLRQCPDARTRGIFRAEIFINDDYWKTKFH